ncbi:MAG: iron ABC transporter permease [Clostridia bacterium]
MKLSNKTWAKPMSFILLAILLVILFMVSINLGSIKVGFFELIKGIFDGQSSDVNAIKDLRFPRIIISMLAGAALATSGALLQAVLKNPLADPGIIGVSSGAGFFAIIATVLFPQFYFIAPAVAILGGIFAFALVYTLASKQGLSPIRILLVGIAVQALFTGLSSSINTMSGSDLSGVASIVEGNITLKTWSDVSMLAWYVIPTLIVAVCLAKKCDLIQLEDKTVRSLGINIDHLRIIISLIAVILASSATAIVGIVSFLGLLVPHIARLFVGSTNKYLLPFSAVLGAFIFLLADTVGRTIASPYEINAAVIMSVVGGPVFIFLLRRSSKIYGK